MDNYPLAKSDCKKECDNDKGSVMDCKRCLRSPECDVPWNMCLHFDPENTIKKEVKKKKTPFEAYKERH